MADYNLGSARGTIELAYKDNGAPRKASRDLSGVGKAAAIAGGVVAKAAGGIAIAGGIVAAGLVSAINAASTFDAKMSGIQAVSGATVHEMEAIRQKALQLGKDTVFSAGGAADAITELAKAGISLHDILNGAADATVSLAAAGGVDLPQAATIASNAMNQFQLRAKDMPRIADLIAGAANASAIDVMDLGNSLAYVGPVAHALGMNIADVSTAIAILGNQGIKGSAAGTALRSILAQLTPQTKKAKLAFSELGLVTKNGTNLFYNAHGQIKPLNEVIQILHDKTKNLTAQQKVAFTKKSFGTEDLAAVSILMGQTGASVDKMATSISKVKAADVAKTKMDNLKGSTEQLKGSIETLQIVLGEKLQPYLKRVVDTANNFVGVLIEASSRIPQLVAYVRTLATQALALLSQAWHNEIVQRYVTSLERLYAVLDGPVSSALHLILAVLLILAPLVAGAIYVAFVGFSYVLQGLASTAEFVSRNIKTIGIIAAAVGIILSPILIVNAGLFVALGIAALVSGARQTASWAASIAGAIRAGVVMYINTLKIIAGWVMMGASAIASAAQFALSIAIIIGNYILLGAQAVLAAIRVAASWAVQTAAAIAGRIVQLAALVMVAIQWAITAAASLISAAQVALAWLIAMGPIGLIIAAVIALALVIIFHWRQIAAFLTSIMSSIWHAMVAAWNAVTGAVRSAVSAVVGFVRAHWQLLVAMLLGPLALVVLGVIRHWQSIKRKFDEGVAFIKGIPGKIKAALGDLGNLLFQAGKDLIQGLINGIKNMAGEAADAAKSVAGGVKHAVTGFLGIKSPSTVFHEIGVNTVLGMVNGMKQARNTLVAQGVSMVNALTTGIARGQIGTSGIESKVQTFLTQLSRAQQAGVAGARSISGVISRDNAALVRLMNQRESIAARLTKANAVLTALQKSFNDTRTTVANGIIGTFDVTQSNGNITGTIGTLQDLVQQALDFKTNIAALLKKGFSRDEVAKLAAAGPQAAADQINAFLAATPDQVKRVNSLVASLAATAGQVGTSVADSLYGAGIRAAQGLVNGLKSQSAAIQRQMNAIALAMIHTVKRALGIHSPSRVFHGFGINTLRGYINGVESEFPSLLATMGNVAKISSANANVGVNNARFSGGRTAAVPDNRPTKVYDIDIHQAKDRPTQRLIVDTLQQVETLHGDVGPY